VSVDYEWRLRVVMAEHGMFKANQRPVAGHACMDVDAWCPQG
jgi:hypothetical protein